MISISISTLVSQGASIINQLMGTAYASGLQTFEYSSRLNFIKKPTNQIKLCKVDYPMQKIKEYIKQRKESRFFSME